ncbi:sugar phosphate isomerase/epimerase family protein [Planctellipticum variicoloris]|uniref:sugar phosphate isomerase/epimerase family protein n=1 Tax=Planctellipticum variicoloris TaxID=3064265 RepID=UPI00301381C0|nr:sugar phosphate isomerase/epimerase [Planctomycetaceae bacterium SH412]
MKFAICQELFEGWDWERQCQSIAEIGYTGIEVAPFTLADRIGDVSPERRRELRRQAQAQGLTIVGLHWLLAKTTGLHLTAFDPRTRNETAKYLRELAQGCADLGGSTLVFGSPAQRSLERGMNRKQALANATEVFSAVMPIFADCGVTLCIEPLTPNETDFLNTCAEARVLIEMVDHPNFRLIQDVKAMLSEPTPIPQLIAQYADVTRHFHVNDDNLLGPGMGPTDYKPIFQALLDSKYDGWVSVEVFDYRPGPEHIAKESLSYMQSVLRELQPSQ